MSGRADGIEVTKAPEQLGPYLLLDRIGAGGMAEGWRAVRFVGDDLAHKVFVKRILHEHRSDPDYVRWFLREAAIAMSLRHANIVGTIEPDPDGRYLVFELIDGLDLRHLLRSHPDRRLPVDLSVLILTEVLKGLEHAHTRTSGGAPAGIIHRDLDPSNILISYQGEVKIADFGVAAVIRGDGEPHTHVVGKKHYQSPEETRNECNLDGRSDLFSLGVVGYEMLSGERPFTGTRAEIARAIAAGRFVPLQQVEPTVPTALAGIIERLLSPDPAGRFATALECQHAIYAAHAPDPMLYRDLGRMALRARPHETIELSQLRSLVAPHGSHPPRAQEDTPTRRQPATDEAATVPNAAATTAAIGGIEQTEHSNPTEAPTARVAAWAEDGATDARRARRRVRGYAALGMSLAAAGIVTALRIVDSTNQQQQPPPRDAVAKAISKAAVSPSLPEPPAATAIAPITAPAAADSEPSAPAPTTPEATSATLTGTLRIGAVPQSQVWVDGQLVGWSPIIGLRVQAGVHTVSIGRDDREEASTRRVVTVTSGHQQRVGF